MSNKIVQQPINIVSNPIQTIYFRTSSDYYNNGGNLALFTIKLIGVLFLIGFIPTLLLTLYGEFIFIFILGDQWMQAGQVSSIMATSFFFSFIYATITYGRVVMGRQKSNLASTIFYLIILIFLLFLFNFNNNLFIQTIFAVSIASLLFNVSNIYITLKYMNNYHNEFLIFSILFIVINAFILVLKYIN
jgi:O-antigen/teichoic acid export membrane protein